MKGLGVIELRVLEELCAETESEVVSNEEIEVCKQLVTRGLAHIEQWEEIIEAESNEDWEVYTEHEEYSATLLGRSMLPIFKSK